MRAADLGAVFRAGLTDGRSTHSSATPLSASSSIGTCGSHHVRAAVGRRRSRPIQDLFVWRRRRSSPPDESASSSRSSRRATGRFRSPRTCRVFWKRLIRRFGSSSAGVTRSTPGRNRRTKFLTLCRQKLFTSAFFVAGRPQEIPIPRAFFAGLPLVRGLLSKTYRKLAE